MLWLLFFDRLPFGPDVSLRAQRFPVQLSPRKLSAPVLSLEFCGEHRVSSREAVLVISIIHLAITRQSVPSKSPLLSFPRSIRQSSSICFVTSRSLSDPNSSVFDNLSHSLNLPLIYFEIFHSTSARNISSSSQHLTQPERHPRANSASPLWLTNNQHGGSLSQDFIELKERTLPASRRRFGSARSVMPVFSYSNSIW